jgi:hypothetical protein
VALLVGALSASVPPALGQPAPLAPDTVLPPPRGDEGPPPSLLTPVPPSATPAPGPFAPRPATPFPPRDAQDPFCQPRDPGQNGWGWDDWPSLPEHFFGDVEIDILKPHLKAALTNVVTFPDGTKVNVQPPTTQVAWTAAPRFEVGWFIYPNLGYLALSYRGFADDAQQIATSLDGTPFALRTRLDVNQAAFDYGTLPYSYAPRWFVAGRIGIAAADVFFDNRAVSAAQAQYASNNYYGAGPHVRLDLWREFNLLPGLSVFAQPDLVVLVGQIQQHYREDNVANGYTSSAFFIQRKTETVPVFTFRTGLSYTPSSLNNWRFMVGYEFEEWWSVGQLNGFNSRGQFYTNGVFLRTLVSY